MHALTGTFLESIETSMNDEIGGPELWSLVPFWPQLGEQLYLEELGSCCNEFLCSNCV
jgi:hypothetical protein